VKSKSGFPVIENDGNYRVVEVRASGKRSRFAFNNLATEVQQKQGYFGLVEYQNGELAQCISAAMHASHFGHSYVVERINDKRQMAVFANGQDVTV